MDYRSLILRDHPFWYFPLDDAGSTVLDITGHGFSGAPTGAITTGTVPFAGSGPSKLFTKPQGWPFPTVQPKYRITDTGITLLSATPHPPLAFTLETWFRIVNPSAAPAGSGYTLLDIVSGAEQTWEMAASTGGSGLGYPFFLLNLFRPGSGLTLPAYTNTLTYDTLWHHYVAVFDPSYSSLPTVYQDGLAVSVNPETAFSGIDSAVTLAVIGGAFSTGDATSEYAHHAVYDYPLSAHQIACHQTMATLGTQDCYPTGVRLTLAPGSPSAVRLKVRPGTTERVTINA